MTWDVETDSSQGLFSWEPGSLVVVTLMPGEWFARLMYSGENFELWHGTVVR